MAMTKMEKAAFAATIKMRDEALAMRFIDYRPVPMIPAEEQQIGWTFNRYNRSVNRGCFRRSGHSNFRLDRTDSQSAGGPWYASESDAQKALRVAVQQDFAEILAILDKRIEEAIKKEAEEKA